jgi:hypothetical protein
MKPVEEARIPVPADTFCSRRTFLQAGAGAVAMTAASVVCALAPTTGVLAGFSEATRNLPRAPVEV